MNIPNLQGNWIDFLILIILAFYVLEGWEKGFWRLLGSLVSFIGSLALALRFYPVASKLLVANFSFPHSFANAIGFLLAAFVSEPILSLLAYKLIKKLPVAVVQSGINRLLGIVPSVLNGLILIAFFLTLFVALPVNPKIKSDVTNSKIGGYLVSRTLQFERELSNIFGGALKDTLTYFTIEPGSNERVSLPARPQTLTVDSQAERQMLTLVNEERRKQGIKELVWDEKIAAVARAHSKDIWDRKYFAHVDPDGKGPADRLERAGISFTLAGENLALAPTVELAHQGLMNSEGHRRNILEPGFGKIGIGVIDGGVYGKMFTQNFTD